VFRVQDGLNYYYVALDRGTGTTRMGEVVNGIGFAAAAARRSYAWPGGPAYKVNEPIAISVQMNATGIFVWVRTSI
jgi:hypothetical protein